MMTVVRLNDATFVDLKSVSTWLGTKTPSETIDLLVREKMDALDLERDAGENVAAEKATGGALVFEKTPGLSFTRIISASINSERFEKMNWAQLLLKAVEIVKSSGVEGDALVRALQVPSKSDQYLRDGYQYYPNLGISIQGQSAQDAWKEVKRLAHKYRFPAEVQFQWRENEKAQHPGEIGVIRASL